MCSSDLTFEEHAALMYDLQLLAYQSDLTRVITFMYGREITGRTYPALGINESHHSISHHGEDPEKLAKLGWRPTLSSNDAVLRAIDELAGGRA